MTRSHAWRFLDVGRRLERAIGLVRLVRHTLVEATPSPADRPAALLEALLEVCDSGITYRRRYLATLQVAPVLDLLLTDDGNPRSLLFQLEALSEHWQALGVPELSSPGGQTPRSGAAAGGAAGGGRRGAGGEGRARPPPAAGCPAGPSGDGAASAVPAAVGRLPESRHRVAAPDEVQRSMRLRVRHSTRYRYTDPVATSHHEAHLSPALRSRRHRAGQPGQHRADAHLPVRPARLLRQRDADVQPARASPAAGRGGGVRRRQPPAGAGRSGAGGLAALGNGPRPAARRLQPGRACRPRDDRPDGADRGQRGRARIRPERRFPRGGRSCRGCAT